jgi:copper chaperone CopZ
LSHWVEKLVGNLFPLPSTLYPISGKEYSVAQKVRFLVPDLWADHHVIKVRKVLVGAPGVVSVDASAAFKEIAVEYDSTATNPDQLAGMLAAAGYPPATGITPEDGKVVYGEFDAMWRERGSRAATTNELDIQMSGDFRRY